jgi:hypothetical protein
MSHTNQNTHTYSCLGSGLNVRKAVTNGDAAVKVQIEVGCRLQEHARQGLSPRVICLIASNPMLRMKWAMINPRDRRAFCCEASAHPVRELGKCILFEIAAPNSGLVADDDDRAVDLLSPKSGEIKNAWSELELLNLMHIPAIDIDHAVAVEEKSAAIVA